MTDAGTTQDNFILLAQPVGGLPISQDWLDRMKLVWDRTIPIILPSGKNILVDVMIITNQWSTTCLKTYLTSESELPLKSVVEHWLEQEIATTLVRYAR